MTDKILEKLFELQDIEYVNFNKNSFQMLTKI